MRRYRSFLLLEVVLGLALLAGLGVGLVRLQAGALRQINAARQRAELAALVEALVWSWNETQTPVTLPATGAFDDHRRWRRELRPVRVGGGLLATQVSVIATVADRDGPRDVFRVDWLIPATPREPGGRP